MKNKILKFTENPLIFAIMINIIFIISFFFFFHMRYETNDDIAMKTILNGAYGELSSFTFFSNIFLGYFLKSLYSITTSIDWYFLFHTIITFISLTSICFVFLKPKNKAGKNRIVGIVLSIILLVIGGSDLYLIVNFTKTAGVISIAGFLLLISYIKGNNRNLFSLLLGNFLFLVGSFIRFESMLLAGLFFFIIFCIDIPTYFKQHTLVSYIKKYIIAFGPILAILLLCIITNYNYDPNYKDFNTARSNVMDKTFIDYDKYAKEYKKIDVSKNDIDMLKEWSFDDPQFFTQEKLTKIAEISGTKVSVRVAFKKSFELIIKSTNYIVCIFAVLTMFVHSRNVRGRLIHVFALVFIWLAYFYFAWIGRAVYRCEFVIWLSVFVIYAYHLLESENSICKDNKKMIKIIFLVLFLSSNVYNPLLKNKPIKNKPIEGVNLKQNVKLLELLKGCKENLYLFDTTTLGLLQYGDVFDIYNTFQIGEYMNILPLGSWLVNHPVNKYALSHYGVKNPLKDMLGNNNVYVIDSTSTINKKTLYLQEHYNENLLIRQVSSLNGIPVFQYFKKAFDFSDRTITDSEYVFEETETFKDVNSTYIQGKISLSNEEAMNHNVCIEIYDSADNKVHSDVGTLYFDKNMDFRELEFNISNSKIPDTSQYYYKVYLENDNTLEHLGDFKLNPTETKE